FLFARDTSPRTVQQFNQTIVQNRDNYGSQLRITSFEAIGLLVIKIDDNFDERIFRLVLEALISGNSVVISSSKTIQEFLQLKEYLDSSNKNVFNLMDTTDVKDVANSVLTVGAKSVGLYLRDVDKISRKSFVKFAKSTTLSFGDMSYAK